LFHREERKAQRNAKKLHALAVKKSLESSILIYLFLTFVNIFLSDLQKNSLFFKPMKMMKTIKLLLLFLLPLLLGQGVKGQEYHKLLQDNVDWDVLSVNGSMNPFCGYVAGCRFFLRGDTTIQGNDYKIINCIKIISPQPGPFCPPFFVTQDTVFRQGYIREDTIAKKVFVYDHYDGDALLYDFSLSVGDTLKYSSFNWCGDLIVDSIGTITLFNSETRKIFFFLGSDEYFIEGIGGSQGLNNAMCWFESCTSHFVF
jgi:hypothetical protein